VNPGDGIPDRPGRSRGCPLAVGGVAFLILAALKMEPLGYAGSGLVALAWLGLIATGFVATLAGLFLRRPRVRRIGLVVAAAAFLAMPAAKLVTNRQRSISERRGDAIVAALERYRGVHASYPESLAQLHAIGFEPVPRSAVGAFSKPAFRYDRTPEGGFRLAFDLPNWYVVSYDSMRRRWRRHD
jgi:hypothetical protein